MIRAILLDAAGTLIEPAEPVATTYARLLARHGIACESQALARAFGPAFRDAGEPDYLGFPDGETAERTWWRGVVDATLAACGHGPASDDAFTALFDHYADPSAWRVFPEVREFIQRAGSHRLAVVSNFDQRLHLIFQGLDLDRHFEFILTSSAAGARKPSAAIFRQAMEMLGLPAEAVLHTGDSPDADIRGAAAAGIRAYFIHRPATDLLSLLDQLPER